MKTNTFINLQQKAATVLSGVFFEGPTGKTNHFRQLATNSEKI
ncbi:MAG: hypothetical protein QM731_02035 [Chitinophagaceae bacterium]